MEPVLTAEQAQQVFDKMAGLGDEIAFRWLWEGCECRAQVMIDHMQAMGLIPGRAWALAVGRELMFPDPKNPRHFFKWKNHVAPVLAVDGVEYGVLVIDPSISPQGPLTLIRWAAAARATAIEVSHAGLPQAEIISRHAARALQGKQLDAMIFSLRLGEPPIPETGGSGFRIGQDPPGGPSIHARLVMKELLKKQKEAEAGSS